MANRTICIFVTHTLQKPREYRKTIVPGIDEQWQADLVKMKEFSEHNDGYNYLLCVVDCYFKYAWCDKLKTKTGQETARALEQIFNKGRTPNKLQFDMGKEFYNEKVKKPFERKRHRIFQYRFRQESIYYRKI